MNNTTRTLGACLLAVSLTFAGATIANATETCTPVPAWTEHVTITDAVPATPAVLEQSHTVTHDAVDAVTRNDYQRYSWVKAKNDKKTPLELGATPTSSPERWQANTTNYEGAGHGTDPVGVAFQSNGNGHGNWFFWTVDVVTVSEGSPAWVETVIDVVGIPATPGTDAVTETVEHAATVCPPVIVPPVEPATDVCLNIDGIQTEIPDGMEAGPATEGGPTCMPADLPCPGFDVCPVDVPPIDSSTPETTNPAIPSENPDDSAAELAYTGSTTPIIPIGVASLLLAAGAYLIRKAARA